MNAQHELTCKYLNLFKFQHLVNKVKENVFQKKECVVDLWLLLLLKIQEKPSASNSLLCWKLIEFVKVWLELPQPIPLLYFFHHVYLQLFFFFFKCFWPVNTLDQTASIHRKLYKRQNYKKLKKKHFKINKESIYA